MEEKIEALAANVEKLQKTFDWMIAQMVKKQEQGGKNVQGKNDDPFNSFIGGGSLNDIPFPGIYGTKQQPE